MSYPVNAERLHAFLACRVDGARMHAYLRYVDKLSASRRDDQSAPVSCVRHARPAHHLTVCAYRTHVTQSLYGHASAQTN